jgi:hypothetical protein
MLTLLFVLVVFPAEGGEHVMYYGNKKVLGKA